MAKLWQSFKSCAKLNEGFDEVDRQQKQDNVVAKFNDFDPRQKLMESDSSKQNKCPKLEQQKAQLKIWIKQCLRLQMKICRRTSDCVIYEC